MIMYYCYTYLWILLINPTAHRSSGMVVWPTRRVPWCSARQITLLGFPVPLGTAPIGIRFFPCPPIMCRHLNVEEVISWPYLDFNEAWLPLPKTGRMECDNAKSRTIHKGLKQPLCFIFNRPVCILCDLMSFILLYYFLPSSIILLNQKMIIQHLIGKCSSGSFLPVHPPSFSFLWVLAAFNNIDGFSLHCPV